MQATATPSSGGGLSAWRVSQHHQQHQQQPPPSRAGHVGKLSSLLSAHLSSGGGASPTSAQSGQHWRQLLTSRQTIFTPANGPPGAAAARGMAIQRTIMERERHAKALAAGGSGTASRAGRPQTSAPPAAALSAPNSARRPHPPSAAPTYTPSDPHAFALEAKLAAAEQQASKYRERISGLERRLHVALVTAERTDTSGQRSAGHTQPIDHFPMPPSRAARRTAFLGPPNEEKQQSSSSATTAVGDGASGRLTPPAMYPPFRINTDTFEFTSTTSEVAGLNQLLDEYEGLFERQAQELKAVRQENEKLKLQLALTNTLAGLVEKAEADEEATQGVSHSTGMDGRLVSRSHLALHQPTLSSAGVSQMLTHNLSGDQGAPAWLAGLIAAQEKDAPIASSIGASAQPPSSSPFTSASRIHHRGLALKYILSTLAPHLNVRDRSITVLLDEFVREHAWLSGAFAQQSTLVNALVDHLRKMELGLETEEEKMSGLQFFQRREQQQREKAEADRLADVNARAMVLWRGGAGGGVPYGQQFGLAAGSAGAIATQRSLADQQQAMLLRQNSNTFSSSPSSSPVAPVPPLQQPPRNGPVQVDGGGSHVVGLGSEWLSGDEAGASGRVTGASRPFRHLPHLHETEEGLKTHLMRLVMGGGIDVPLSALKLEHAFTHDRASQMKGYSDQPGGMDAAAAAAASASSSAQQQQQQQRRPDTANSDEDDSPLRSSSYVSTRTGKDTFRERDGQTHHIPASVRKWSTVAQLDYVLTSAEYSVDSSSRKPRVRTTKVNREHERERERGVSRAYTQTAMGALSESAGDASASYEEEAYLEIADPLAPSEGIRAGGTDEWEKERARLAQEKQLQQQHQQQQQQQLMSHQHPAPPSLLLPPTRVHFPSVPSASSSSLSSLSSSHTPLHPPAHPAVPPTPMFAALSLSPPIVQGSVFSQQIAAATAAQAATHAVPAAVAPTPSIPSMDASPAVLPPVSLQSESVPLSQLKLLYELLKFVSFKLTHTQQLKHVVHVVRRLVQSDRVTLWFVDHVRGHIWSTVGTAVTNEIRVRLGVGIAGGVAASGKSVTMTNATYDQRFLKKVESGTDYLTKAVIAIPLKTPRHQTFAVLQIMNKVGGGYFSRTDELLAHLACQHLSQNLWASEMYQVALREKLKTQAVFQHAEQLLSCLDVKEMLHSLTGRVRMLMDADYAVLFALSSNAPEKELASIGGGGGGRNDSPEELDEVEEEHGSGENDHPSAGSQANAHASHPRRRATGGGVGGGAGGPSGSTRSSRRRPVASWGDDLSEPLREELLTVTESCTQQIAIIIPQGYASDQRGEGFKFNAIRVPLSSGGLAAQSVKSGRVVNIFDTRLDARFNGMTDEYISDTAGSGLGGKSAKCTRAFCVIPIHGPGGANNGSSSPDGVLVLGKLIPKPFQSWEIGEVAELTNVLWMGVRRYRQDRLANIRMHDRLASINRMVSHLDLEAGGSGVVVGLQTSDDETASITAALAKGAVVVTEEGGAASSSLGGNAAAGGHGAQGTNVMVGKMKDPISGEFLPSLAEYQRNRMLFPSAPQLGSTLADAFFRNDLTRTNDNPYGTLLPSMGQDLAGGGGGGGGGLGGGAAGGVFLSGRSTTMDALPRNPALDAHALELQRLREEQEMRDPNAPARPTDSTRGHMRQSTSLTLKPVETLTLHRENAEAPLIHSNSTAAAASGAGANGHPSGEEDEVLEDDEGIFSSPLGKKKQLAGPPQVDKPPPQPLKPLDYSKATYTAPIEGKKQPMFAAEEASELIGAPSPRHITPDPSASSSPSSLSVVVSSLSPLITQYKPVSHSLIPSPAHVERVDAFHETVVHSVTSKSASGLGGGGVAMMFNDSAGSGFGIVPVNAAGRILSPNSSSTVSRIALRNTTDYREVDAIKNVTYGTPKHAQPRAN